MPDLTVGFFVDVDHFGGGSLVGPVSAELFVDPDSFGQAAIGQILLPALFSDVDLIYAASASALVAPPYFVDVDSYPGGVVAGPLIGSLFHDADTLFGGIVAGPIIATRFNDVDHFGTPVVTGSIVAARYNDVDQFLGAVITTNVNLTETNIFSAFDAFPTVTVAGPVTAGLLSESDHFGRPTVSGPVIAASIIESDIFYPARLSGGVRTTQPPQQWSMEAIFYLWSVADGTICGWQRDVDGAGAEYDRLLRIAGGNFRVDLLNNDDEENLIAAPAQASRVTHVVITCDANTLTMYVDGFPYLMSVTGGGYNKYSFSPYFTIGRVGAGNVAFDGVMLLCNFAALPWTPAEVSQRFADPYGFLKWPGGSQGTGWDAGWWDVSVPEGVSKAGWDLGMWDATPTPVVPPAIDAVTKALFTGGELDLRPAGVSIEYATQSLSGTPMFSWDAEAPGGLQVIPYFTWDGDDSDGWDVGNWDGTPLSYVPPILECPPTMVAGWDLGAWATFEQVT